MRCALCVVCRSLLVVCRLVVGGLLHIVSCCWLCDVRCLVCGGVCRLLFVV